VQKIGTMALYFARMLLILFCVTFFITVIVRLLPGDPVSTLLPFSTDQERLALAKDLGIDKNIFSYYFSWLNQFIHGDFGRYYTTNAVGGISVNSMIAETLPRTLLLMMYTVVFSLAIAIPSGIFMAYRVDTRADKILSNTLFGISSIPNFVIGLGLAYLLGVRFNMLDPVGYRPISDGLGVHFRSIVMPVISLSAGTIAAFARLLRVDTIATLKDDFVTMAASKGLSNRYILCRHVFRPSSFTLLTSTALNMASLIGGAVVIESVFALNGFGMLLTTSIALRQYLAIQSLIALVAVSYVLFNFVVDILYTIIDPRVRSHRGA